MPLAHPETIHQRLERERKLANPKPTQLKDFRNYARGQQKSTLTSEQQRFLRGVTGRTFCDNVCKMVLQAATQRIQLARFEVEDQSVLDWLSDFWTLVNLPVISNQVHWATLRDGNHALALTWDNEKGHVRLVREKWWDGKTGIFIGYDNQDVQTYAVKEWKNERGQMRRVIWWPDRIERYIADGNGWKPYAPDQETAWTDEWIDKEGKPLGLPVVHFRNAYMPNDSSEDDSDTSYGVSELDGGVLGLQDEINDIQRDITAAARITAYQIVWGSGVKLLKDSSDVPIPLKIEPGVALTVEDTGGRFGTLSAGSLIELERGLLIKLKAISRMTATPLHQITGGDWPSGEALLQADKPLVKKAITIGEVFGPAWGSLLHKATMLANTFGGLSLDTGAMITTVYRSVEWLDELTQARIAASVAPYVSEQEVLRILGNSPDKIRLILGERAEEAKEKMARVPGSQPGIMGNHSTNADKDTPNPGGNDVNPDREGAQ